MSMDARAVGAAPGAARLQVQLLDLGRVCLGVVRRVPFTLGLLATVWLLAALTGSLGHGVPPAVNARFGFAPVDLVNGRFYTVFTSVLFIHKRFMVGPLNLSVLLFVLPYEWTAGTRRILAAFWGGQAIESALTGAGILVLAAQGYAPAQQLRGIADVGMSAGAFACAGALVAVLPGRFSRPAAAALALYLLAMLAFSHQMYDLDHALVAPIGYAIASLGRSPRQGEPL